MAARKRAKKSRSRTRKFTLRGRHRGGDPVSVQISVQLKRVPKGVKITDKLIEQMIRRKAETSAGKYDPKSDSVIGAREGVDPRGIKLKIISWKNSDRDSKKLRADRDHGSQADRWGSLWQIIAVAPIRLRRNRSQR